MDIGKALGFVFEDERWLGKILIGALITLIPVFGQFALVGYGIAVIRNVLAGNPRPLPEWSNLVGYFMDGLKVSVVNIIYSAPMLIIFCPFLLLVLIPLLGERGQEAIAGLTIVLFLGVGCLLSIYGILLGLLTPAIQIRYAATGAIGQCLRVGEMFSFTFSNLGSVIIAILVPAVIFAFLGSILATLTVGLLALPMAVWMIAASAHLYGQIGRQAGVTVYQYSSY